MTYSVVAKTIVNIRIGGIEAESQQEAIAKMLEQTDFHRIFDRVGVEYGEEISCYLVDEVGDEEYENSHWYGSDGKTLLDGNNLCAECLRPMPTEPEACQLHPGSCDCAEKGQLK